VRTYFALRPQVVITENRISQPVFASRNSIAGIGNTGGLPTRDVEIYALVDGELDQALQAARAYLAAHPAGSRAVRWPG
jgi:hypothetical protein